MVRIDTHLHLLHPDRFRYDWVEGFPSLQGSFTLDDYAAAETAPVSEAIFMEVDVAF